MIPNFNEKGHLLAALHQATLDEFETRFVTEPISETRASIFRGYLDYRAELEPLRVAIRQWVDGSFTTAKQNPIDIDLVTQWDGAKVDRDQARAQLARLTLSIWRLFSPFCPHVASTVMIRS